MSRVLPGKARVRLCDARLSLTKPIYSCRFCAHALCGGLFVPSLWLLQHHRDDWRHRCCHRRGCFAAAVPHVHVRCACSLLTSPERTRDVSPCHALTAAPLRAAGAVQDPPQGDGGGEPRPLLGERHLLVHAWAGPLRCGGEPPGQALGGSLAGSRHMCCHGHAQMER